MLLVIKTRPNEAIVFFGANIDAGSMRAHPIDMYDNVGIV